MTKNDGLISELFVLYLIGFKSSSMTFPPDSSTIHCAAAVSHSEVEPNRGYISALPSATRQNFFELPTDRTFAFFILEIKDCCLLFP